MDNETHFLVDDDVLQKFSENVCALWCRPISILECPPDALTFLRDYVCPSVPCIIKNAIPSDTRDRQEPFTLTLDEIICLVGEKETLTVDTTPDGHGDCIRSVIECNANNNKQNLRMFVMPHQTTMSIGKFRDALRRCQEQDIQSIIYDENAFQVNTKSDSLPVYPLLHHDTVNSENVDEETSFDGDGHGPVVYYSKQNDCLRTEMKKLFSKKIFPSSFPFAEQAFGTGPPEAINLWIGNERSVSSMHKDHYENLFYVCSGEKEFLLCPPADILFLSEEEFRTGTFCPQPRKSVDNINLDWAVIACDESEKTKWISDKSFAEQSSSRSILLSKAHPIKILVSEGELLYIPSLWYHRVTQTCETVGVNYWYDMKFDQRWCYFDFLQSMKAGTRYRT